MTLNFSKRFAWRVLAVMALLVACALVAVNWSAPVGVDAASLDEPFPASQGCVGTTSGVLDTWTVSANGADGEPYLKSGKAAYRAAELLYVWDDSVTPSRLSKSVPTWRIVPNPLAGCDAEGNDASGAYSIHVSDATGPTWAKMRAAAGSDQNNVNTKRLVAGAALDSVEGAVADVGQGLAVALTPARTVKLYDSMPVNYGVYRRAVELRDLDTKNWIKVWTVTPYGGDAALGLIHVRVDAETLSEYDALSPVIHRDWVHVESGVWPSGEGIVDDGSGDTILNENISPYYSVLGGDHTREAISIQDYDLDSNGVWRPNGESHPAWLMTRQSLTDDTPEDTQYPLGTQYVVAVTPDTNGNNDLGGTTQRWNDVPTNRLVRTKDYTAGQSTFSETSYHDTGRDIAIGVGVGGGALVILAGTLPLWYVAAHTPPPPRPPPPPPPPGSPPADPDPPGDPGDPNDPGDSSSDPADNDNNSEDGDSDNNGNDSEHDDDDDNRSEHNGNESDEEAKQQQYNAMNRQLNRIQRTYDRNVEEQDSLRSRMKTELNSEKAGSESLRNVQRYQSRINDLAAENQMLLSKRESISDELSRLGV